ncbi:MAG: ribosome biogenesis GTPase Der [Thermoleophilia bacterium]
MISPTVVVVGAPNAGKSTLVNRLCGSRQAVVHETPGVTRDRKEVELEWEGKLLRMVDTGGYDTAEDSPFAGHVREQVERALAEADVVLFVVDGRSGPVADDHEIAAVLRRTRLPVLLVANKLDDPATVVAAPELYELGLGEPLIVSAVHGLGTGDLLDRLVTTAGAERPGEDGPPDAPAEIPVAIVGRPNAGKSSLFNAIVGEPRTIVSEIAGTTRDAIDTAVTTAEGSFRFIDTAGMRKAAKVSGVEYYAYLRSVQSLDRAHVAVIVVDATIRFGELDLSICTEAARNHCATVIAVNKCDVAEPELEEIAGIARRKLRQRPPVIAVSAQTHRGVKQLLASIASLEARFGAHISTGELNRALATLAAARPLPMKRGKRLKMYYIAQFGTSPPRFAIEVNDRTLLTRDFGFYVENRLRERFELDGVPLVIDFKGKR